MRLLLIWLLVLMFVVGCGGGPDGTPTPTGNAGLGAAPVTVWPAPAVSGEPGALMGEGAPSPDPVPVPSTPSADVALTEAQAPPALAVPSFVTVTVASGDTLLGLAFDHGVPMAALQLQNDLGSSTIVRLGQQLVIPPKSAWEGASPFWIVHVVSQGETLGEIAQVYGLTLADLQGANGLADADLLGIGQALVLPLRDFADVRIATAPTAMPPTVAPTAVLAAAPTGVPVGEPTAAPSTASPASPPVVAPPPADVAAWGRETVRIMNEVRAAHGLPPLAYNETLAQAGQIQANDCATRGWCGHTGSDGSTIKQRVLRVGYQPASWAECWAVRPTPQGAIDIWMDEIPPNDPHRRTLLTTWLTEVGVGVAKAEWGYYYIAVFGKPLR